MQSEQGCQNKTRNRCFLKDHPCFT